MTPIVLLPPTTPQLQQPKSRYKILTETEAKSQAWYWAGEILKDRLAEGWPFEEEKELGDHKKLADSLKWISEYCLHRSGK